MIVKLLTEYHLEFLSLKGGCRGSSESTLVKMLNCWKSHASAQMVIGTFGYVASSNKIFHSVNTYFMHFIKKSIGLFIL